MFSQALVHRDTHKFGGQPEGPPAFESNRKAAGVAGLIGHNPARRRPPAGPKPTHLHAQAVRAQNPLLSIIQAAGWPIWPLILSSIVALALV
ncbi:hypothetical protein LDC_0698, partial [sediment metagenome]